MSRHEGHPHPGQMSLNLNLRALGFHRAGWRHPAAPAGSVEETACLRDLALAAERAKFDAVFMGDSPVLPAWSNGVWPLSYVPEPFCNLAAIAAVTSHIGLIGTASTTYSDLEALAARTAALDWLSGGRLGVNFVTSAGEAVAQNFGHVAHPDHADRYLRAGEFIASILGLWDGEGAAGQPRRPWHAKGRFVDVRARLSAPISAQRRPVVVQAGASDQGRDFAARHAELVYTGSSTLTNGQALYRDLKSRAAGYGRSARALRILPGVVPYVGGTEAEARALHDELEALAEETTDPVAMLGLHLQVDLGAFDPDGPLPVALVSGVTAPGNGVTAQTRLIAWAQDEGLSIRQLAQAARRKLGNVQLNLIGSGAQVADTLELWFREGAADGFNILPPTYPVGADAFFAEVVPELRRRGLFRSDYTDATLRGTLGLAPLAPLSEGAV